MYNHRVHIRLSRSYQYHYLGLGLRLKMALPDAVCQSGLPSREVRGIGTGKAEFLEAKMAMVNSHRALTRFGKTANYACQIISGCSQIWCLSKYDHSQKTSGNDTLADNRPHVVNRPIESRQSKISDPPE